jgi:hypothetical protein
MDWLIVIIVVLLIALILAIYSKGNGRKRNIRREEEAYNELVGYEEHGADRVIEQIEVKEQKDELDYYRLGEVRMFNLNIQEHDDFDLALQAILFNALGDRAQQMFVADRIRDNARIIGHRPLEQKAHFVANVVADRPQNINNTTAWISDSQNVHDSTLNSEVKAQYMKLRDQNGKVDTAKNMDEIYKWVTKLPQNQNINDGLFNMNRGNTSANLDGDNETDLLAHVWERIKHSNNEKELKEAFAQQLADCKGVCLDGRISRVMSSFAKLDDNDPNLGVFKTKEVYRHEMLDNMGSIVKHRVEQEPQEIQDDYNNNKQTDATIKLQNEIKAELNKKAEEYKDKLPEEQRQSLLNAAIESV